MLHSPKEIRAIICGDMIWVYNPFMLHVTQWHIIYEIIIYKYV